MKWLLPSLRFRYFEYVTLFFGASLCVGLTVATSHQAHAEELILAVDAIHTPANIQLKSVRVQDVDSNNPTLEATVLPAQTRTEILALQPPAILRAVYALKGEIRYDDIRGAGFLEMNNVLDTKSYFTRTLQNSGPMQSINGTSSWRPFLVPFYRNSKGSMSEIETGSPTELTLAVVLPEGGTVQLRNIRLVQFAPEEDPFSNPNDWMSQRQLNSALSIAGTAVGLIGGLIGLLCAVGRGQALVLSALRGFMALGAAMTLFSAAAYLRHQPMNLVVPIGGMGILLTIIAGVNLPKLKKYFTELELRKMKAVDVGM